MDFDEFKVMSCLLYFFCVKWRDESVYVYIVIYNYIIFSRSFF